MIDIDLRNAKILELYQRGVLLKKIARKIRWRRKLTETNVRQIIHRLFPGRHRTKEK